jgi:hypothetical protein
MREFRDLYRHQKHILEQLTQDEDTKRVRQIRAGEQAQSVYDTVTGPTSRYAVQRNRRGEIRTIRPDEMTEEEGDTSPYTLYNEADIAEDEVLFSGGRDEGLFKPIANPMVIMENSRITETMIKYGASLLDGADMDEMDEDDFDDNAGKAKALISAGDDSEARQFIHSVPPIWRHAYFEINRNFGKHGREKEDMLDRLDFFAQRLEMSGHELQELSKLELMERDRAYGTSHHDCGAPPLDYLTQALEADHNLSNRVQRIFPSRRPRTWCSGKIRRVDEDYHRATKLLVGQGCWHGLGLVLPQHP